MNNFSDLNDEDVLKALQSARRVTKEELEDDEPEEKKIATTASDMQNCFGFDVS